MLVNGQHFRTIRADARCKFVEIIDQTRLPYTFELIKIASLENMVKAIATMQVRGAPLIGVAAAYGMALAALEDESDAYLDSAAAMLKASRPTAVNLEWAVTRMLHILKDTPLKQRNMVAWREAGQIAQEDVAQCKTIGEHGLALIRAQMKPTKPLQILTHCNAGWLATVDYGTALSPVYAAHDAGVDVHVWVDETRPRNQGYLTAWELGQHGVPHTVITDNAGGHLIQQGLVDMVIVGADRVTARGDVCNKIGTYLKALAAHAHGIPFYAAVPTPTIDWCIQTADDIEIEARSTEEVTEVQGVTAHGELTRLRVTPQGSAAFNPAFDVTPAHLVTAIITERGVWTPEQMVEMAKNGADT